MAPPIEISIPTTSTSSTDSKPFTLYNITLRLPLRSFTVQKRYSDFVTLNETLTSLAGSPPPSPLPQKSWFTRTTSSPALTEQRRKDLEAYLRAINASPDSRWRATPVWRAFLNLPSSTASANASNLHGTLVSPAGGGAPITDPTIWLDCHRDLKSHLHDARLHLARRDQATTAHGQHESSAAAKRCLVKAGAMILALELGLRALSDPKEWGDDGGTSSIEILGEGELRRRRDLLATARKEKDGLEALANSMSLKHNAFSGGTGAAATAQERSTLFSSPNPSQSTLNSNSGISGTTTRGGRILGAPLPETDKTRELDNEGVLQLQRQVMQDQDRDIEEMRKSIAKLRELGVAVNEELVLQNELLGLVDEDVDRLTGKLGVAKKRVGKIS
jgi:regulator of vacuolar morphogenesis